MYNRPRSLVGAVLTFLGLAGGPTIHVKHVGMPRHKRNGGTPSGVAAAKRAKRKSRNIAARARKH